MKKSNDLTKVAFDFVLTLFRMRDLYPEEEKPGLLMEMVKEAVSICACISTAMKLDDEDVKNELLPTAYSATFRIEVMLEISRDLNWLKKIDKPLHSLEKIRSGLEEIMNERMDEIPT
jgi:hypothetical protein